MKQTWNNEFSCEKSSRFLQISSSLPSENDKCFCDYLIQLLKCSWFIPSINQPKYFRNDSNIPNNAIKTSMNQIQSHEKLQNHHRPIKDSFIAHKKNLIETQSSAQNIDIMNNHNRKMWMKKESRTKPKQHRMENYDILTNGFFFFSAVSSPYTNNLGCFHFFSPAICSVRRNTHCSVAFSSWFFRVVLLPSFENSNGSFQLPQKK